MFDLALLLVSFLNFIKFGLNLFYLQTSGTGEQKTKPTQNSVRELRGCGLSPDLVSRDGTERLFNKLNGCHSHCL